MAKLLLVGGTWNGETIEFDPIPCVWVYRRDRELTAWISGTNDLPPLRDVTEEVERYYHVPKSWAHSNVYLEESLNREFWNLTNAAASKRSEARRYAQDADEFNSRVMARIAVELNTEARLLESRAAKLLTISPDS